MNRFKFQEWYWIIRTPTLKKNHVIHSFKRFIIIPAIIIKQNFLFEWKKKKESTKIVVCFFPTQMLTHCYISFCRRDNRLTRTMNIWMWRFAKALPMALWHYLLIKRSLYLYDNFEAKTPTRETKRRKKSPSTEKLHEKVSAKYCRSHRKAWRTWKEWRQNKITKKRNVAFINRTNT